MYLFCVDGLKGFVEAIGAVYPRSQVQRCIVHQIRSATRFVSYRDIKPLMADLKKVYTAVTEDETMENLMAFKDKRGKQYPSCVKSWEENWDILSTLTDDVEIGTWFCPDWEDGLSGKSRALRFHCCLRRSHPPTR